MRAITLSRKFSTRVQQTANVKVCAAMFGIGSNEEIDVVLYDNLTVNVGAGRILYITGDSGAGKSCLLRDIEVKVCAEAGQHGLQQVAMNGIALLEEKPLVDQFGDWSIKEILELLNYVGISEAFVFLRNPQQLSDGQRYRFMLARAIYNAKVNVAPGNTPVIFIDEFLAFLDRETARNVAYQVRRVATKHGLCFVLATTHLDIEADLRPNTRILLQLNLPPQIKHTPLAGV